MLRDAIPPPDPDLQTAPEPVADSGIEWDEASYFWAWHDWLTHVVHLGVGEDDGEACIVAHPHKGEFEFYAHIPRNLGGGQGGGLPAPEGSVIVERRRVSDVEDASYWVSLAWEHLQEEGELDDDDVRGLEDGAREMVDLFFDDALDRVEEELVRRGSGGARK